MRKAEPSPCTARGRGPPPPPAAAAARSGCFCSNSSPDPNPVPNPNPNPNQVWLLLQRLGYQGEPIVALDEALAAFLRADLTPEAASLASTEHTMLLASVRTCCLRGSTGAQGASAPPLPHPTDLGMLVRGVLP